ncbi:unnamed protein product [Coccothraustes coccothraustes]
MSPLLPSPPRRRSVCGSLRRGSEQGGRGSERKRGRAAWGLHRSARASRRQGTGGEGVWGVGRPPAPNDSGIRVVQQSPVRSSVGSLLPASPVRHVCEPLPSSSLGQAFLGMK